VGFVATAKSVLISLAGRKDVINLKAAGYGSDLASYFLQTIYWWSAPRKLNQSE